MSRPLVRIRLEAQSDTVLIATAIRASIKDSVASGENRSDKFHLGKAFAGGNEGQDQNRHDCGVNAKA